MAKQTSAVKLVLKNYYQQTRRGWKLVIPIITLSSLGDVLVYYVPPLVVANLIKNVADEKRITPENLLPYVALMALFWGLGELFWRITFYLLSTFEAKAIANLYKQAMDWIIEKDLGFFNNNFTGSLTKIILAYAHRFEVTFDTLLFNIVCKIVPLIFICIVLWQFSPWLVAALITMTIAIALIAAPLIKRRSKLVRLREEASKTLSGHVADVITNIAAVKSFAGEYHELKTHNEYVDDLIKKSKASWDYHNLKISLSISPLYLATNVVGLMIAIFLGQGNGANIAAIFVTFSYFANFSRTFWDFNNIYRNLESSITEATQFTQLLLEPPKINNIEQAQKLDTPEGKILFAHVEFTHEENEKDTLFYDFNLSIESGEKIGLVGHSGAGKSTITNLLLRFMDVDSGMITIDDKNIAEVTQESLRQNIAYVPQEPLLFHRSIKDNIAYGKPSAGDGEIREAAKKAHALEFIETLPRGFETLVGERGVKLSGGQRQRIAIARAILKDAPILVLDEATSALDSESEHLIQDALKKLMQNRTSIVIAHRLSTISHLDRIVVLDNGKIVEQGSHGELLKNNGIYAKLWSHQSGGFLED